MDALQSERSGLASGTPSRQGAPFQNIPRLVDPGVLDDPSLVAHDVLFQTIPRLVDRGVLDVPRLVDRGILDVPRLVAYDVIVS